MTTLDIRFAEPGEVPPPAQEPVEFAATAIPSVFFQPGWVNLHADTAADLTFHNAGDATLHAELQPWDLLTENRVLFWPQLFVTSPHWQPGAAVDLSIRAGKFDREYSLLATPGPISDPDETTLAFTYDAAGTYKLPGNVEVFGAETVGVFNLDTIDLTLAGGAFTYDPLSADGIYRNEGLLNARARLDYGTDSLPGALALGGGRVATTEETTSGMARQHVGYVQAGAQQGVVVGATTLYGALMYANQSPPIFDDPAAALDYARHPEDYVQATSHFIPKVGVTAPLGDAAGVDAYLGMHIYEVGPGTGWRNTQELGITGTYTIPTQNDGVGVQLIAVGTFIGDSGQITPTGEGKVKFSF